MNGIIIIDIIVHYTTILYHHHQRYLVPCIFSCVYYHEHCYTNAQHS
jgi:hypothetical protein